MRYIRTIIIGMTFLTTALLSPGVMAQQQLLNRSGGELEQHLPCLDNQGRPIKCPWGKPIKGNLTSITPNAEEKNPCNPKGGQPVDTKKCRDYINGNPKPPINPK